MATSLYTDSNSKISSIKDVPINLKTLKTPEEIKIDMQNDISSKKDTITSLEISIKKQQDDYNYNLSTIDDKEIQEKDKLTDKKKEIDDVVLNLEKMKKNNVFDLNTKYKELETAQIAINEAQKKLKDLTDTKNNQEISLAENDVKQAQISLDNEIAKLSSYELKAPFD
jgi:chromosome segregation ATPase